MKISRRVVAGDGTAKKEEKVTSIFNHFYDVDHLHPQGADNQREARLEVRDQDHVPAGGGPGPQQDPRRHRVHHQGQAPRPLQTGGARPQVLLQDFTKRGEYCHSYFISFQQFVHF